MPTSTTNYGLQKPLVNNPTDQDLWGGYLNTDLDNVDELLNTALNWTPSVLTSSFSPPAPTLGSTTTGGAKVLYLCNATTGALAINLPSAATASGMTIAVKKTDSSANPVTLGGNAGELIDAANTFTLTGQYFYVTVSCDGARWNILSQTSPVVNFNNIAITGISTAPTASARTNTTQIASTAYADSASHFGAWTINGYTAGTTYQAATDGFVVAYCQANVGANPILNGYTDSSSAATQVLQSTMSFSNGASPSFTMPVRKNDFWKVTNTNSTTPIISWLPIGN